MNIGELSARTGVSARSLRYYEKLGLIVPERDPNGYRVYGERAVPAASAIQAIFSVGFGRDDVRALLPCATGDGAHDDPELLARVDALRGQVDDRIRALTETRRALDAFAAANLTALSAG
jgi:DNA-binding transcriptional MerR regulator